MAESPSVEPGSEANDRPDVLNDAVFGAARKCQLAFKSITQSDGGNAIPAARIQALFVDSVKHSTNPVITLDDVRDDFEQFRVWTKNLGVFALGQASLDYRLRDATDLRDGFVSLLESLDTELRNCQNLFENDALEPVVNDYDTSSGSSSDSDDGLVSDSSLSSTTKRTALELQFRLKHTGDIIDKIIRLAEVIRASGDHSRATKAAAFTHYEDGINMTEQFESQYLPQILKLRFAIKEENQYLLDRLVQAISLRRRRFMYQAKHQKRLAYGGELDETPLPVEFKSASVVAFPHASVIKTPILPHHTQLNASSLLSTPTKATTFQNIAPKPKAASRIMSSSTKTSTNDSTLPPPPRMAPRATHFQCPYCCILIPSQCQASRLWRAHIIADLQPYICLEPDCPTPNIILSTQESWLEHQRWEHGMEWWCDGDYPCLTPSRYQTAESFGDHLRQSHEYKDAQTISKQIATAGRPSSITFDCCPFCSFIPPHLVASTTGDSSSNVTVLNACQKQLQKHIIDELLKIFLIALPDRDDLLDSKTDTDAPSVDRSTIKALSDMTLTFGNEERARNEDDREASHLEWFSGQLLSVLLSAESVNQSLTDMLDAPLCDADVCNAIWHVVWTSPALQGSVRESYQGPEKDDTLRGFIRYNHSSSTSTPNASDFQVVWLTNRLNDNVIAQALCDELYDISFSKELEEAEPFLYGRIGQHYVVFINTNGFQLDDVDYTRIQRLFPSMKLALMVGSAYNMSVDRLSLCCGDVMVSSSTSTQAHTWPDDLYDLDRSQGESWWVELSDGVLQAVFGLRHSNPHDGYHINELLSNLRDNHPLFLNGALDHHRHHKSTDFSDEQTVHDKNGITPSDASRATYLTSQPDSDALKHQTPTVHYGHVPSVDGLSEYHIGRNEVLQFAAPCNFREIHHRLPHLNFLCLKGVAESERVTCWTYASASASVHAKSLLHRIPANFLPNPETEIKTHRQQLLDSLLVEGTVTSFDRTANAYAGTAGWFIDCINDCVSPQVSGQIHPVLWLRGDKAAGKSTLMKHAVQHYERCQGLTAVYFFFDAQGDPAQNSLFSMMKSLLYQLLCKFTDLQRNLDERPIYEMLTFSQGWTLHLLQWLFGKVNAELGDRIILCFIDGLDLCSPMKIEAILPIVSQYFLASTQYRTCISTTNTIPTITNRKLDLLNLSAHPSQIKDIERYAHEILSLSLDKRRSMEISRQLAIRSGGNFMWALASITLFNTQYRSRGFREAMRLLRNLPNDLKFLFRMYYSKMYLEAAEADVVRLLLSHKCIRFNDFDHSDLEAMFKINDTQMVELMFTYGGPDVVPYKVLYELAVKSRNIDAIKLLLSKVGDHLHPDELLGRTPVLDAVRIGDVDLLRILLEQHYIEPSTPDPLGHTPFSVAIGRQNSTIAELLLTYGAISDSDANPNSPVSLNHIIWIGSVSLLELAMEKLPYILHGFHTASGQDPLDIGSPVLTTLRTNKADMFKAIVLHCNVDLHGNMGGKLLRVAVKEERHNVVAYLSTKPEVEVNFIDEWGVSVLHWAALHTSEARVDMIQALLSRDDINVDASNGTRSSALQYALNGHYDHVVADLILMKARRQGLIT